MIQLITLIDKPELRTCLEGLEALIAQFRADTDPNRTDLLVGVYKTNEGKAYVLPSVKEV
jgi:aspartate aminotransferase